MITVQDRNGKHLEECADTPHNRNILKEKYGNTAYFFSAEPSRETAIGPGRITSPRRFSLVSE